LTENFAEIVDASAHLMASTTALLASARGETVAELGEGSLRF
jgi:hypothetical protein